MRAKKIMGSKHDGAFILADFFTRYFAWIPKATRNDGSVFMSQVLETGQQGRAADRKKKRGKVIVLFDKNDSKTTHPTKKAHSD